MLADDSYIFIFSAGAPALPPCHFRRHVNRRLAIFSGQCLERGDAASVGLNRRPHRAGCGYWPKPTCRGGENHSVRLGVRDCPLPRAGPRAAAVLPSLIPRSGREVRARREPGGRHGACGRLGQSYHIHLRATLNQVNGSSVGVATAGASSSGLSQINAVSAATLLGSLSRGLLPVLLLSSLSEPGGVDRCVLTFSEPKRRRDREYLRFAARLAMSGKSARKPISITNHLPGGVSRHAAWPN